MFQFFEDLIDLPPYEDLNFPVWVLRRNG